MPGSRQQAPNGQKRYRALVLAGSRQYPDPVAEAANVSEKAFAPIAGQPMIDYVLAALEGSERIGHIQISFSENAKLDDEAPDLAQKIEEGRYERLDAKGGPSASVLAAIDKLPDETPLFVTTADHPLLTSQLVNTFLLEAEKMDADVAAGLAPLDLVQSIYPRGRRTKLSFRDGDFSGCNMFVFMTKRARKAVLFWQKIEHDRKRPLRLVARLGLLSLLTHILGRLSLKAALARLGRRAGVEARPIIIQDANAATDVDSAHDLALIRSILEKKKQSAKTTTGN